MPSQEGARSDDGGDLLEPLKPNLLGLGGQPSARVVVESGLSAQLLFEDLDLLLEILDAVLRIAVDPTGQANQGEFKTVHQRRMGFCEWPGHCFSAAWQHPCNSPGQTGSSAILHQRASFRTVRRLTAPLTLLVAAGDRIPLEPEADTRAGVQDSIFARNSNVVRKAIRVFGRLSVAR